MVNKHIKGCLKPLAIKETHIKTTPCKMAMIEKTSNNMFCQRCGETRTHIQILIGILNVAATLEKNLKVFKNVKHILPYDSATQLLDFD